MCPYTVCKYTHCVTKNSDSIRFPQTISSVEVGYEGKSKDDEILNLYDVIQTIQVPQHTVEEQF